MRTSLTSSFPRLWLRVQFGSRGRYTKSSLLVGKAKSFKPMHDYPSSTFERFEETESGLLSECPCVALTASDGRGFPNSCGEGYTSLGTIWGLRDVIFECQNCQHDTQNGLLQNRVVQNGAQYAAKPTTALPVLLATVLVPFRELTGLATGWAGISHHLEVYKTKTAGWGMRCFNEIPAGSFICTYEGEIMTSDECEDRAKQPGMTDRYYFDLEIKSVCPDIVLGRAAPTHSAVLELVLIAEISG